MKKRITKKQLSGLDTCPLWPYRLGKKFSEKSSIVGGISEKKGGKNE